MTRRKPDELGELLSAYLDNEVTAEERAEVEKLLTADAKVRTRLDALRQVTEATQALPVEPAPPEVLDAVTARLERETLLGGMDAEVTLARHRRPPLRATLSVAAMLAVAIGGGLYVSLQLSRTSDQESRLALNEESKRDRGLSNNKKLAPPAAPPRELGLPSDRPATSVDDLFSRAAGERTGRDNVSSAFSEESEAVDLYAAIDAPKSKVEKSSIGKTDTRSESTKLIAETTQDMVAEMGAAMGGSEEGTIVADASPEVDDNVAQRSQRKKSRGRRADNRVAGGNPNAREFAAARAELHRDLTPLPVDTFEQRLRAGEDGPELQTQNFAAEPLRLTVVVTDAAQQAVSVERLTTLFAERGMTQLEDDAESSAAGGGEFRRRSLVSRAARAATLPDRRLLYFEGEPGTNFAADEAGERCLLARIPAGWLPEVLAAAAPTDGDSVTLQVGTLTASGPDAARSLAQRVVDQPPAAATPQETAPRADLTEWLDRIARLMHSRSAPILRRKQPTRATPKELGTDALASAPASVAFDAQAQTETEMIASDGAIVIAAPTEGDIADLPSDTALGEVERVNETVMTLGEATSVRALDPSDALVTLVIELRVAAQQPAP